MGLLDWLLPGNTSTAMTPEVVQGIERLIQTVDPRFKALSSAPAKLAPVVESALDFCRRTVEEMPGPLDASPENWRETLALQALFTRTDELQQIFSRQQEIQDFITEHPGCETVYALLGAVLEEKKGFGVALSGEALQHDVAQTTLNFSRHRLFIPRESDGNLREASIWGLFDQLGIEILARLTRMKESREDLKEEIALLRTHLAQLQHQGLGNVFCNEDDPEEGERKNCTVLAEQLSTRLAAREAALQQAHRQLLTLDDALAWVVETLAQPAELVDVDRLDYRINSMNLLVGPEEGGQALHLSHFRFSAPNPRQGVILRVRYPRSALIPRSILNQEIERLYG